VSIIDSLRKLGDPNAARDRQVQLTITVETPLHEKLEPTPEFECRVCRYVGLEPEFCPDCLAQTMRPLQRPAEPAPAAVRPEPEPSAITPEATLDLRALKPSEVSERVSDHVQAAAARGLRLICIVHGTSGGRPKRNIERALAREPLVEHFAPANEPAGATLVKLRGR
jgi:hypothetical protein